MITVRTQECRTGWTVWFGMRRAAGTAGTREKFQRPRQLVQAQIDASGRKGYISSTANGA
jgi:hypothetical protein